MVLLIGGDLNARARVEAACSVAGQHLRQVSAGGLRAVLEEGPASLVLVDLDAGREEVVALLGTERAAGRLQGRVVGFFSHVDEALGAAARDAGIETRPRGRFWRELPDLVAEV